MFVRTGDNVKMILGKDRGKTGKILRVFPSSGKVVVEGLNKIKKHQRAKKQGQKGQIIEKERSVYASDVQIICTACHKPTRVGHRITGGEKARICRKCGVSI